MLNTNDISHDDASSSNSNQQEAQQSQTPILEKVSLDGNLVALQLSPTLIRIVPVTQQRPSAPIEEGATSAGIANSGGGTDHHLYQKLPSQSSTKSNTTPNNKHWTIDVKTGSPEPVSSMSPFTSTSGTATSSSKFSASTALSSAFSSSANTANHATIEATSRVSILPGGMIWSDHGGNSQDFVIVTTISMICYKVSLIRNQMAITYSFRHPYASAVWWEPIARTIVIGSYRTYSTNETSHNDKQSSSQENSTMALEHAEGRNGSAPSANESNRTMADRTANTLMSLLLPPPPPTTTKRKTTATTTSRNTILELRTFILRFPKSSDEKKKRRPRFELPPPHQLPPFSIGQNRHHFSPVIATIQDKSNDGTNESCDRSIRPTEISVVNLYQIPFLVEVEALLNAYFAVRFYRLDRSPLGRGSLACECRIPNITTSIQDIETMLICVVDSVLCICLRECGKRIFIDIADASVVTASTTRNIYNESSNSTNCCFLVETLASDDLSMDSPSGLTSKFSLDLDRLYAIMDAPTTTTTSNVQPHSFTSPEFTFAPFFLRRQENSSSSHPHDLALNKFARVLSIDSPAERQRWINAIIDLYAIQPTPNMQQHHLQPKQIPYVDRDWTTTAHLMYDCALLHSGAELKYRELDHEIRRLASSTSSAYPEQRYSVICQYDILEHILLPNVRDAIMTSNFRLLRRSLDVALGLLGALDDTRRQSHGPTHSRATKIVAPTAAPATAVDCPPCPALECLIVALLWRLGCEQEIIEMIRSRAQIASQYASLRATRVNTGNRSYRRRTPTKKKNIDFGDDIDDDDFFQRNQAIANQATFLLVQIWNIISVEVEFGINSQSYRSNIATQGRKQKILSAPAQSQYERLRNCIRTESTKLLSLRCTDPLMVVQHLLSAGRLETAMSIGNSLPISTLGTDKNMARDASDIGLTSPFRRWDSSIVPSSNVSTTLEAIVDPITVVPQQSFLRQHVSGAVFFEVAISKAHRVKDMLKRYRMFHNLHSFLLVWDPSILQRRRRRTSRHLLPLGTLKSKQLTPLSMKTSLASRFVHRCSSSRNISDDRPLTYLELRQGQATVEDAVLDTNEFGSKSATCSNHIRKRFLQRRPSMSSLELFNMGRSTAVEEPTTVSHSKQLNTTSSDQSKNDETDTGTHTKAKLETISEGQSLLAEMFPYHLDFLFVECKDENEVDNNEVAVTCLANLHRMFGFADL